LGSLSLLIPNSATLPETNSNVTDLTGSLGNMAQNCTGKSLCRCQVDHLLTRTDTWDRPPNFLLVDYYNYGNFNGSVFKVAANMNNVSYTRQCCGKESAASLSASVAGVSTVALVALGVQMLVSAF
jgi:hypothetical protein